MFSHAGSGIHDWRVTIRPLGLDDALEDAALHGGAAEAKLARIARALAPRGALMLRTFDVDEQEDFLDLAWQEIEATRFLTPPDGPRTLRHVAHRIIEEFNDFDGLASAPPRPGLDPTWFSTCRMIQRSFDWDEVNRPWLLPARPDERRHSPNTHMYISEGVHTTLVIAVGLELGERHWMPLEAVFAGNRDLADSVEGAPE